MNKFDFTNGRVVITAFSYGKSDLVCRNDIYTVVLFLTKTLRVPMTRITILTDIKSEKHDLKGYSQKEIYAYNIIEVFRSIDRIIIVNGIQHYHSLLYRCINDRLRCPLLLYFTCHADPGYLMIPENNYFNMYSGKLIVELLKTVVYNTTILFIFDCCFSESILPLTYRNTYNKVGKLNNDISLNCTVVTLCSSLRDQPSGHLGYKSLFTVYLIKFLELQYTNNIEQFLYITLRIHNKRKLQKRKAQTPCVLSNKYVKSIPFILYSDINKK